MKKTIAALVVVTAAASISIARAEQGDDKGMGGHRHGRRGPDQAQLLEKYDANHNGVLDPEEKAAAKADWEANRAEREKKMLERFDANHNGVLDPEEKEAAHKEWRARDEARRADMLKKYDADGDGKLSDTEREALRKDMREKHKQEGESR
jgi:hypothetical protein